MYPDEQCGGAAGLGDGLRTGYQTDLTHENTFLCIEGLTIGPQGGKGGIKTWGLLLPERDQDCITFSLSDWFIPQNEPT